MKTRELAEWCVKLGMHGMEGIPKTAYKEVMDLGLEISLVGSHGFSQGPCDPRHTDMVIEKLLHMGQDFYLPLQIPMMAFAIFGSFLQAFIFTCLASLYIGQKVTHEEGHGEESHGH